MSGPFDAQVLYSNKRGEKNHKCLANFPSWLQSAGNISALFIAGMKEKVMRERCATKWAKDRAQPCLIITVIFLTQQAVLEKL